MITALPFESVWPVVSQRLRSYLHGRRLPPHDIDDVVQECGVRLLTHEVPFHDAEDLLRWCTTVARNLHVDSWRKQSRLLAGEVPETDSGVDVFRAVAARLELQQVVSAWPTISEHDQRALLSAAEGQPAPTDRKEAVREYVRRNRARNRLRALIAAVAGIFAGMSRHAVRVSAGAVVAAAVIVSTNLVGPTSSADAGAGSTWAGVSTTSQVAQLPAHAAPGRAAARAATRTSWTGRRPVQRPTTPQRGWTARGPAGTTVTVTPHARPRDDHGHLCLGGVGLVPDTCLVLHAPPAGSLAGQSALR